MTLTNVCHPNAVRIAGQTAVKWPDSQLSRSLAGASHVETPPLELGLPDVAPQVVDA